MIQQISNILEFESCMVLLIVADFLMEIRWPVPKNIKIYSPVTEVFASKEVKHSKAFCVMNYFSCTHLVSRLFEKETDWKYEIHI